MGLWAKHEPVKTIEFLSRSRWNYYSLLTVFLFEESEKRLIHCFLPKKQLNVVGRQLYDDVEPYVPTRVMGPT